MRPSPLLAIRLVWGLLQEGMEGRTRGPMSTQRHEVPHPRPGLKVA